MSPADDTEDDHLCARVQSGEQGHRAVQRLLGERVAPWLTGLFTGLLPACGKNATGPCVLFKKSNQHNVGFFGVLAPGTFDPAG